MKRKFYDDYEIVIDNFIPLVICFNNWCDNYDINPCND